MSSALSVDDVRLLEKTLSIRERMIDNLLLGELPTKARDIDSFTNLLESVDRTIINKAKISIEESANRINEETKGALTDLLLNLHKGIIPPNVVKDVQDRSIPVYEPKGLAIDEGVLIPKTDHVSLADVTPDN